MLTNGVGLTSFLAGQSLYSATVLVAELPSGIAADKLGHRKVILFGIASYFTCFAIYIVSPSLFLFASMAAGITTALLSGSVEALLYESVKQTQAPQTYQKHLAQLLSGETLAFALGAAIAGAAFEVFGEGSFLPLLVLMALMQVIAFLVALQLQKPEVVPGVRTPKKTQAKNKRALLTVLKTEQSLRRLTMSRMLTVSGQYIVLGVYPVFFAEKSVSGFWVGAALAVGTILNAIFMRNVHCLKSFANRKTICGLTLFMAVTYFSLAIISHPLVLVMMFICLQAQFNLKEPLVSEAIQRRSDEHNRATILSASAFFRQVSNLVSKIVLTTLVAVTTIDTMFMFQAGFLFVGAVASYFVLKAKKLKAAI